MKIKTNAKIKNRIKNLPKDIHLQKKFGDIIIAFSKYSAAAC